MVFFFVICYRNSAQRHLVQITDHYQGPTHTPHAVHFTVVIIIIIITMHVLYIIFVRSLHVFKNWLRSSNIFLTNRPPRIIVCDLRFSFVHYTYIICNGYYYYIYSRKVLFYYCLAAFFLFTKYLLFTCILYNV